MLLFFVVYHWGFNKHFDQKEIKREVKSATVCDHLTADLCPFESSQSSESEHGSAVEAAADGSGQFRG